MSASLLNKETGKQQTGVKARTDTTTPGERPISELSDLVDIYAVAAFLPPADWVTRLNLVRPRRDMLCLSVGTRFLKRLLDIVVSLIMIVLLAPVLLFTALAVRVTSHGPVVFRQQRVGLNLRGGKKTTKDRRLGSKAAIPEPGDRRKGIDRRAKANYGKPFTLYKFRTMRTDAEKDGAQFATKGDPRVTSIGRFLRKTRLDELPQLWNVLKGEMTLVGPRPERPEFMKELSDEIPNYLDRLGLKPGLTGPAQIINGYDNNIESFRRKVALDLLYLQNCCLWNDIKILFRTIRVVLTGSGAM
jgi:lipopolysaccharide/colanic/teichoic acid biosynthesis glycosyltransferase